MEDLTKARQIRCVRCLHKHRVLVVTDVSDGNAACERCNHRPGIMTDKDYRKAIRTARRAAAESEA